jgi:tripartite-type tricarboxylate transporter receptor subunit TctC
MFKNLKHERGKTMKRIIAFFASALVLATAQVNSAHANDDAAGFPKKSIKIVVPYPPGGSTDALARILGQKIQERLGQTVIVENKAGASGNIGAQYAAKSPADGYTLFLGTSTALAVNPHLYKSTLRYDPQKDFAPVILATTLPSLVVVNKTVPVKSMKELNTYLKNRPEPATYASAGNGTPAHLGVEMYKTIMGIKLDHVPYKGGAPALTDLIGGQTTVMFAILPESMPFVKDGKLRALAITTANRSPLMPDLPTVAESGVPGYELIGWYGFLAPAGTPKEIVAKLNNAFNSAMQEKEVREKLAGMGFDIVGGPPERLAELMRTDSQKWGKVVADANVKID